jgi:hypothetical protein
MRRTKIKTRANSPSKPVHSNVGNPVAQSPDCSPSPIRLSGSDMSPLEGCYSVYNNADTPGVTIEQRASVLLPPELLSRVAYAQVATATPNARNILGVPEAGDWLDKLEEAICPTTMAPLGLTDSRAWMRLLEPRPIRPARAGTLRKSS